MLQFLFFSFYFVISVSVSKSSDYMQRVCEPSEYSMFTMKRCRINESDRTDIHVRQCNHCICLYFTTIHRKDEDNGWKMLWAHREESQKELYINQYKCAICILECLAFFKAFADADAACRKPPSLLSSSSSLSPATYLCAQLTNDKDEI